MQIRDIADADLDAFVPIFRAIVQDGETYAYPENLSDAQIRSLWFESPPGRTVVAVDGQAGITVGHESLLGGCGP